jgi:UPF0755 protein
MSDSTVDVEPNTSDQPVIVPATVNDAPEYEYLDPDYLPPVIVDGEPDDGKDWVRLPHRMGRLPRLVTSALCSVLLVVAVVGGAYWYGNKALYPGSVDTDSYLAAVDAAGDNAGAEVDVEGVELVEFFIAEGDTLTDVANSLGDVGVVRWGPMWRVWAQRQGFDEVQAGQYFLPKNADADLVSALLERGPAAAVFGRFVVPEGLELTQMTAEIAEDIDWLESGDLNAALFSGDVPSEYLLQGGDSYEGILFPAQYDVELDEPAAEILKRMADQMVAEVDKLNFNARVNDFDYINDPYELIVLASLIEKEARTKSDQARISRVIHNRLADGEKLEIDATFLYSGCGSGWTAGDPVLGVWRELDCAHNTYANTGLPPTPIAAPGRDALEAAANPTADPDFENSKFYVLCDQSGNHCFADTFAEHQANIDQAREDGIL